ncbi:MAG: metal ABC transporter substrate-binding protein [Candidatus Odinarchaeota archaeon]
MSIPRDWAQQVAGDLFTITSIVTGFENIHTYSPKFSEIQSVKNADLFIWMGLEGVEQWVKDVIADMPANKILTLINASAGEYIEHDDVTGVDNPHVWMSPVNAKEMVEKIYSRFVELDGANEATYTVNRNHYKTELDDLLASIEQKKTAFNGLKVVVHHPSFKYLFDLLGIDRVAAVEEKEGSEPSAQHIADVTQLMKEQNITLLVNQPQLAEDDIVEIARDTGAKIADLTPLLPVEVDGWEKETVETYVDMIRYDIWALENPHDPPAVTVSSAGLLIAVTALVVRTGAWKRKR